MAQINEETLELNEDEKKVLSELKFPISRSVYSIAQDLDWTHDRTRKALVGVEVLPFIEVEEEYSGRQLARYYTMNREKYQEFKNHVF